MRHKRQTFQSAMTRVLRPAPAWRMLLCLFPFVCSAQDGVTTLAGTPLVSGTNDGAAATALFSDPTGLTLDTAGNLYICDNQNHAIRKLSTNGIVSTFVGQRGHSGSSDATGTNASFNNPSGIAVGPSGLFYVTDTGNNTIRCITSNGVVTTLAGTAGQSGATNAAGKLARFNSPLGIAVDASGIVYVADSGNHLIRKITSTGTVTTLAGSPGVWGTNDGTGSAALFNGPVGIAIDAKTNLFVSDANNHTIRRITPGGIVTTWAGCPGMDGTTDATGNAALFRKPGDLKLDRNGILYVVDSFNHTIRQITTNAAVSTIAGLAGNGGHADGLGSAARLFNPYGLAADHNGNLRISDTYNQTIRFAYAPITASLAPNLAGDGFVIRWQSVLGDVYQVQFKDAAQSTAWQNLSAPITATDSIATFSDDSPLAAQRFYRVLLLR